MVLVLLLLLLLILIIIIFIITTIIRRIIRRIFSSFLRPLLLPLLLPLPLPFLPFPAAHRSHHLLRLHACLLRLRRHLSQPPVTHPDQPQHHHHPPLVLRRRHAPAQHRPRHRQRRRVGAAERFLRLQLRQLQARPVAAPRILHHLCRPLPVPAKNNMTRGYREVRTVFYVRTIRVCTLTTYSSRRSPTQRL